MALIGLMADESSRLLVGLLGIVKSGHAFVPIDPAYPAERVEFILNECSVEILVTERKYLAQAQQFSESCTALQHVLCLDELNENPPLVQGSEPLPQSPAYVIYTSGSTGKPKGVPITHENLFPLLMWSRDYFGFGEHTRVLQNLSYCFDFGVFELLTTILFGGTIYFPQTFRENPQWGYAEFVKEHGINTIHTTPTAFREIIAPGGKLESLEVLHLGGEQLTKNSVDEIVTRVGPHCVLFNGYGPTEATVNCAIFKLGAAAELNGQRQINIPIGSASAANVLFVLDRNLQLVPVGVPGELYVGGAGLASGYLNRPDVSADRFIPNPFSQRSGTRLYRTGDLVRLLPDGNLEFMGRVDHQVKIGGYRVELGEIETALHAHPAIRECAVLAVEDARGDSRLVAYVSGAPQPEIDARELRAFLKQSLPEYMVPGVFVSLPALPMTPNGKLDRRALPAPENSGIEGDEDYAAPITPNEEVVANICAEVLGLKRLGRHENLFDVGCHSLLATKIVSRLRAAFHSELSLLHVFQTPTVAGLARAVETNQSAEHYLEAPPLSPFARDGQAPLSFPQERLWFLSQLDPTSVSYSVPRALRIKGKLNVKALEDTFSEIIRRHEILRTTFPVAEGAAVQMIHPPQPVTIPLLDFSDFIASDQEEKLRRLTLEEGSRPFDLERGPLLRLNLVRCGPEHHILLLTEQHLIHDGWTQGVLIRELLSIYTAFAAAQPSPLPELPIQYADFTLWQRQWLQGEVMDQLLSYWKKQLAGAAPFLQLPADRLRPAVQTHRGAQFTVELPTPLAEALRALSRREGATLFMVLLSAFKALLFRYTGQADISVGTGIANRRWFEIESLIGMIINTIVLRTKLDGDPGFRELLTRVREGCLGAYANQDLPFGKLVEALQPARDPSYSPLFQVMFALHDAPEQSLELPGLELSLIDTHNQSAKFDLTVIMIPHYEQAVGVGERNADGSITTLIEYNTDLFDGETIERLWRHYLNILEAVTGNADLRLSRLPLLSAGELKLQLHSWNQTSSPLQLNAAPHLLVHQHAVETPNSLAVSSPKQSLTFRQLHRAAARLAYKLRGGGAGSECSVAILLDHSAESVVSALAASYCSAAYLPLDPTQPPERLALMLENARPVAVLTSTELLERLPPAWSNLALAVDQHWQELTNESATEEFVELSPPHPEQLAYVIFTSGSTGTPRAVGVTHRGLANLVEWHVRSYNITPADRASLLAGVAFDASVWELWPNLAAGASLHVPELDVRHSSAELAAWLIREQITRSFVPTPMAEALFDENLAGADLQTLLTGGDRLRRGGRAEWGFNFVNHYGPTESSVVTTSGEIAPEEEAPSIGKPIANTKVYVLDQQLQPVPIGVTGELYIGGNGLARGYLNKPALTAERFVSDPFSEEPGGRLYRSGDLVRYRSSGNLEFVGRVDQQVKIRGFRIELGEIEAAVLAHAQVRECVVLASEDAPGGKRLVAYVVAADETGLGLADLRLHLKERLPDYMLPAIFIVLDKLPVTANGKLDRKALPVPASSSAGDYEPPRSATEELLAYSFSDLLQLERVSRHESFFELGGHSLLATQLVSRIRASFDIELPLRLVFEEPTVVALAAQIERLRAESLGNTTRATVPALRPLRADGAKLPLSFAQQRLWFLNRLEPDSAFYNMPAAIRIKGELQVEALERTLSEIVRRHEVLRTRFVIEGNEPCQEVLPAEEVKLPVADLTNLDEKEREAALSAAMIAESSEPFDLAHGPMLRVKLLRLSEEEHVILLTMHHIVSDGWSAGLLIKEVGTLYEAYSQGEQSPLPELPVQYGDFAVWQRGWLQGDELERQLAYWREQLGGELAVLELPTDRPRSVLQSHRGGHQQFGLGTEITAQLRELSRREGVTLFMTLLAAFQILLQRYSGQQEIVVGTDVANRNYQETESLIGFFVNQLVLRTDMSGEPTFVELLKRVKEVCLGAYAHQDVPFEKLVEELQPERDLSRSALFQVKLVLQNAPQESLRLGGLQLGRVGVEGVTAKFDLMLTLVEGNELRGVLEFNTDLYERARMARLLGHFEVLLQGIVAEPQRRLSELALLGAEELERLRGWSEQLHDEEATALVTELFEAQVARRPEAMAIVCGAEQLSYEELNRRANQLGHYLRAQGVGAEVVVGLCLERSVELVVGLLGILKAGGAYVPLDPAYPRQRLEYLLSDAQVGLVLTQGRLLDQLPVHWGQTIAIDDEWTVIAAESAENLQSITTAENLAYVIYTSGSTGQPKGVMISHGNVWQLLRGLQETVYAELGEGLRVGWNASLSFDASVQQWVQLLAGHSVYLLSEEERVEAGRVLEYVREQGVQVLDTTPGQLRTWLEAGLGEGRGGEQLAALLVGGEAIDVQLWEALARQTPAVSYNVYGPAECTVDSTWSEVRGVRPVLGQRLPHASVYVLDEQMGLAPVGVRGELCIGGGGVGRGYWQRAELTAERFVPHPYSAVGGERLYRTGDEGRYLEDGTIEYLGRRDQQVKVRGYRIELGEIEAVLESHAAVRQAVVTVREEQQLVVYVVGESWLGSEREMVAELRPYLRQRLPEYMVPQRWGLLEQMPLTVSGKIDRERLPAPTSEREMEWDGEATPVEELVAGIWSEVLKVSAVGREENFFELGGHSLLAVQVISRVRQVFGVEIGLRRLFEEPTLGGFSRSIEEELRAGAGVTVPALERLGAEERAQWGEMLPLSFAQQRLWFLDQLEQGNPFYNSFKAVRLKGELNVAALERTLSEIVRRHEVLRTRFVNVGGEPRQEVLETAPLRLTLTDFSSLIVTEREAAVLEAATAEKREPFDLATGPMLRVKLLRLSDEDHVVLLTMHHIASDGWSMDVLSKEVAALYEAYSQGQESPLAELPIQYADFAVWQRGWLQGQELERQLSYWRRQLGGEMPTLELPTDRERPAVPSYSGAQLSFGLSAEVSSGLKELSRREGVTLFMTLLGAFQTLLHRHNGQQEIVVGMTLAGRTYRETESLIGFFINQLPLRTDLSGEPTFVELLQRVKEVCLGAYAHQDMPFEKLVEELQPERDLSRSPLFQVAFGLQNVPQTAAQLGELELQPVSVESESVRYDLTLWLAEGRENLSLWWTYRDELFSAERIKWLQGRFERLLEEIVAQPECRLSQLVVESRVEEEEREAREAERRAALEAGGVAELVAVDEVEGYELTAQQEQVWERGGETWLWGAVRVAGELEVERVQRVVRELAATEEVLRSGFARLAGMEQPLQVLRSESAVLVEVEEAETAVLEERIEQWGQRRDWEESNEQWSVKLWQVSGGEETVLAVRMRPLCGDRETVRSVIEEVLAEYERELLGVEQGEVARRVQYADYGAWQKEVREEEGAEGRSYWEREQRSGEQQRELRLGLEHGVVGGEWRQQRVAMAGALVEQLRREAAAAEVSEAAVLLSAWQLLLWRHTEVEVVEVESRVSGRGYEELQGALGRYERCVPVRVRVRSEASWRELLRETGARLEEVEKWQEYYLAGKGVESEAGAGERIGYEYVSWTREWAGAEWRAQWERLEERVGGQKLKLRVESEASGLSMQLEYDEGVLSAAAAEWLSEQYVQLLSEVSGAPEQLVSAAVLVSAREREQVLSGWNAVQVFESEAAPNEGARNVAQLFEAQVEQRPEATAIVSGGEQLSFGELNRRANQLAHYLRGQGVGAEVVVGLCLERSVELVVGLLGILKAGGAYLPLDPNYPRARLEYLLADARVQLVLTQQRLLERLPLTGSALAGVLALDQEWERIATENTANTANLEPVTEAENLAYVIYTSGSTGQPKGVMISHGNLWQLLQGLQQSVYAELGAEQLRVGWNASLSFDASVKQWLQLLQGHAIYLLGEEERLEAGRVLEYVQEQGVQVLDTTPGQLQTWLEAGLGAGLSRGAGGEQLAAVLVGGEAIAAGLWQELGVLQQPVFYNLYGPTECTVDATWSEVSGGRAVLGQRLPHVSVYVLDEQLRLAAVGVRGELCIGGGGVGRGYWQRAELTGERYVPHPYSAVGGERLYRTGDEGRYLEDGRIEYLGRADQQVKVRGYRIELEEIAVVLESHEAVRQAVVTVREEQQLVAYLVGRRGVQWQESGVGERSEGYEVSAGLRVAQQNKNETDYLYREIFERRCYLQHGVSIERGDWVVDVGANIGMFSLQAAQLGAARVYAFEPLGAVCASLRQNARLGGGRIRVFEHGLSGAEGEAQFTYYPRYTMMSGQSEYADAAGEVEVIKRYLANEAGGGSSEAAALLREADELLAGRFTGQAQQCRLRRLTDVLREEQVRRVDLLKIDVQRAEWDVLQGLEAEDWERIGQVVLEVHDWEGGSGRAAAIRELLQAQGYEVTVAQDELLVGTDRYNVYGVRRGYREHSNGNGNGQAAMVEAEEEEEEWSNGGEWEVNEVREYARERLPEYMVPQRWVVLEQLPLTAHGKVDRERLPAPVTERAAERETEGEWTAVEELVAGIWNEVLKQEVVGRGESFFELGGHSLLATQVISRAREMFGVEIGLRRLFEEPTLAGFSRSIEEEMRAGAGVTVPALERLGAEERAEWGGELPLSFAQQRLWFLDQLERGNPFYNSFKAVRLKGELNVAALERTLSEIVRRHEVLRTRFVNVGGEPRQQVLEAEAVSLPVTDLSGLAEVEREAAVRAAALAEKGEPFDLATGPMLRVKLLRLSAEEHVVLLTMHHIVSDAWSLGILIKEVTTLYEAYRKGLESPLPELEVQYVDFALWQRGWLQGEELERQLEYWRNQLGTAVSVLELPTDRARPAVQSYRGAHLGFALSTEISTGLKELSRREGVTLFMTLLAAFQTLLQRYSGQEEIVVGTDVANRNYRETEGLIGFFVNQLVLNTDLSGEPTFVELLQRVKEVCLGAYAHQDLPFEKLVEEWQPERDLSRSPLFQVKLLLHNPDNQSLTMENLELQPVTTVSTDPVAAKLDLMLRVIDLGSHLTASFNYLSDLFKNTTISRMQTHLVTILEAILEDPHQPISEIRLSSPSSSLITCNKIDPEIVIKKTLPELFEAQVERTPNAVAIVSGTEQLSYGQLNRRANRLAHYLRKQGVGAEVAVGLCMERSMEMIVALLGILKAGGAYLPLDPAYPRQRLEYLLSDAQVGLVLTQGRLLDQLPVHWGQTIAIDDEWTVIAAESAENLPSITTAENLAYVIYTSGSTGQPKGVMITNGGLVNYLQYAIATYPFAAGSGSPLHSTLSFDLTVTSLYAPLLVGGWTEVMSESRGLEAAWQEGSGYGVVKLTPAHLRLLNSTEESAERLRQWSTGVIVGGEALSWEQVRPWVAAGVRVYNEYGPTETVVGSCVYELEAGAEERGANGGVPIGRPIHNTEMYVLDQWQRPVAVGVRGELYIGGAGLGRGYWGRAELTAERFVPHPYSGRGGERLYRSGDEGRDLEDGRIEYLGRRDQQVKVRGYRIELGEIEAVLESHAAVRQAVVMMREDRAGDQRLVAYLLGCKESDIEDLKLHVSERLPAYMVPQAWMILEAVPLTKNGKLDRAALPIPERQTKKTVSEPLTTLQQAVATIWAEVLEIDQIDLNDNFFELGGHSLLGAQVISRVREAFNIDIYLRSLFEQPTLGRFSAAIEEFLIAEILALPEEAPDRMALQ